MQDCIPLMNIYELHLLGWRGYDFSLPEPPHCIYLKSLLEERRVRSG